MIRAIPRPGPAFPGLLAVPHVVLLATLLCLIPLAAPFAPGRALEADGHQAVETDLARILTRIEENLLSTGAPDTEGIRVLIRTLDESGSWKDIDYEEQHRAGWKTPSHLDRLFAMALAFRSEGNPLADDPKLLEASKRALGFWLAKDFKNPNWWWNRIGVPRRLYGTLVLLRDHLDEKLMAGGLKILTRGKLGMTGQNRIWVSDITLTRACLEGDVALAAKAFESVASTFTLGGKEGVQADMSFFQHGKCLYSGGYGLGFSVDGARLAALARGTAFAFSEENIDIMTRYILDGQRWMLRGAMKDPGIIGRQITRKGESGRILAEACRQMARLDTGRRDEFEIFARSIEGRALPEDPPLSGHRHFFRGEFTAHHRPGFFVSVRTCSERIDNTDSPCNSEGMLSHHVADGAVFIHRHGGEYRDVFGAWDWERIPGTTVERKGLSGNPRRHGMGPFAGGVSDGDCGVTAFHLEVGDLTVRKAWFCFDDEVLCLGSGIACASEHPVITSLNQCRLKGAVTAGRGASKVETVAPGCHDLLGTRWIHHDGVGYLVEPEAALRLEAGPRLDDWRRINHRYPEGTSTLDVFDLRIDHGTGPRDAAYAYWILPGCTADQAAERAVSPRTVIVVNEPGVQAAAHPATGRLGVVFHEKGQFAIAADRLGFDEGENPLHLAAGGPVLLLFRFEKERWILDSADPRAGSEPVDVMVNRWFEGKNVRGDREAQASVVRLTHPSGAMAGATVSKVLMIGRK